MGLFSKLVEAMQEQEAPERGASTGPIVWRTERRRIGDLVDWEANPRRLTDKQAEDLKSSLQKFGYVEEIVVNADGRSIIGGHMRRRVAIAQALLDPDALVDVRIPSRPLNEQEGIELAIRLNKNTGEWDLDALANSFDEVVLREWGFGDFDFGRHHTSAPVGDQTAETRTGFDVIVSLPDEEAQRELLFELSERGLSCRAVVY